MKKLVLFILAAVMMVGCIEKEKPNERYYKSGRWVEVIDSCEYIPRFGHKGNCRFCEQRRKAEIREIVELLKDK